MVRIPVEHQEFLRNTKQVIFPDQQSRWMTLKEITKAVMAGEAEDWSVIYIDFDTGEASQMCAYCATGVEHPDDEASPVTSVAASVTLH
jgi:hypothetical protein